MPLDPRFFEKPSGNRGPTLWRGFMLSPHMRRREFFAIVVGSTALWPFASAGKDSESSQRIGILMGLPASDAEGQRWIRSYIQGLRDLGWRNGVNVQIDLRWAEHVDQMRKSAEQLVDLRPDIIHVTTALATAEVLRQTKTIPIVFSMVNDPVALGFSQSHQQPGTNVTGLTNVISDMAQKWLHLLKEMKPHLTRAVVLFNPVPGSQFENRWLQFQTAGQLVGLTVEAAPVRRIAEIEDKLGSLNQDPNTGLIIIPDAFFNLTRSNYISSLVERYRFVTIYPSRDYALTGGLASYSVDAADLERRAADYTDRILKGAKPSDLPVLHPTKFELVINLRAARAIGLDVPQSVLTQASDIIK